VLIIDDWKMWKNDKWINQIIKNKQDVYAASPLTYENLWDFPEDGPPQGRQTVLAREVKMLTDAGYKWDGFHLRSPKR
jgi:hypothetical protein